MMAIRYSVILILLLVLELVYFRVADRFNIIDKPNQRSSHSTIVLRGGGIVFLLGVWIWAAFFGFPGGNAYPLFLAAVTLAAGISFVDDVKSLPDAVRLAIQFVAMALLIGQLYVAAGEGSFLADSSLPMLMLFFVAALVVCVGATNIYNFMDGINGITAGYSLAVLVPLALMNARSEFIDGSFLVVAILAVLVFSFFNFRPRGKAKCFAGDVGSVGIAFVLLFAIGMLIVRTGDVSWLVFLLVYGVDGCLTICHRIMLHENLGEAHRKHAYQLMANELGLSHVVVSVIYMVLQLVISLGFIYLCPVIAESGTLSGAAGSGAGLSLIAVHWIYLAVALLVLALAYVLFMKKYYHLHEEYLASIGK